MNAFWILLSNWSGTFTLKTLGILSRSEKTLESLLWYCCWLSQHWVDCLRTIGRPDRRTDTNDWGALIFIVTVPGAWRHVSTASDFGASQWCKRDPLNKRLVWRRQWKTADKHNGLYLRSGLCAKKHWASWITIFKLILENSIEKPFLRWKRPLGMSVLLSNTTSQERFATLDLKVTATINKVWEMSFSLAAKVKGGWRNACTERRQRGGEKGYLEKGLKSTGREQFKVGIRQDRESLRGKAHGQRVGGACWPWGHSLTAEEARHPRVFGNCLASPGARPIQTTGSPLYPHSSNVDREAVNEGECDTKLVFSNMHLKLQSHACPVLWLIVAIHRVIVACVCWKPGSDTVLFFVISKTRVSSFNTASFQ